MALEITLSRGALGPAIRRANNVAARNAAVAAADKLPFPRA